MVDALSESTSAPKSTVPLIKVASSAYSIASDPVIYAEIPDSVRIHYDSWIVCIMESKSIVRIDASLCIYIESAQGWMEHLQL